MGKYEDDRAEFLRRVRAGLEEPVAAVVVVPIGEECVGPALCFAKMLREAGVSCVVVPVGRKVKRILSDAVEEGSFFAVFVGEDEVRDGTVVVKDLDERAQWSSPEEDAVEKFRRECRAASSAR